MIKIAVCDDNEEVNDLLERVITKKFCKEVSITKHGNSISLISHIEEDIKGNLDVVFLDINLGKDNGIEIAKRVKYAFPHIKIIFMTGFVDYAQDIFDVNPIYFLIKPFCENKIIDALNKADEIIQNENLQVISLVTKVGVINIRVNNIKYVESIDKIIRVYEHNMVREARMRLNEVVEKLPINFLRCHQSYIVNMDRIMKIDINGIVLHSGERIPVSRPKYSQARKTFLKYLGESI